MNNSVFFRLLKSLKPYILFLILSIICSILYVICSLFIPILVGNAIDVIIEINNVDFEVLKQIIYKILFCLILAAIAQYLMNLCNNYLTYSLTRDLRNQSFNKIQKLPLKYLDAHQSGDIVSRIITDIETISDGILLGFNQVFTGIVMIITTLVFMFSMNYIMAIVVIVLTPLSLFVARFIAKKIHRFFYEQTVIKGEQTSFIEEMVNGQKVIRAFNHEKEPREI